MLQNHAIALTALRTLGAVALATSVARARQNATDLVSVGTNASQALDDCDHASISNNGRFVGFATRTLKLDPSHIGAGARQVYARDRWTDTTQRLNLATSFSSPSPYNDSYAPSISATGCAMAFTSNVSNLVLSSPVTDVNASYDVFVRWATPVSGAFGNCTSNGPDICASSFVSTSSGLVTPCASSDQPCISGDGAFVAFRHFTNALASFCDLPLPTGASLPSLTFANVWMANVTTSPPMLTVVSDAAINGAIQVGESSNPVVSFDGNFVAFESLADLAGDPNLGKFDIFRFDRSVPAIIAISPPCEAPCEFTTPSISDDGSVIAFDDDQDVYVAVVSGGIVSLSVITSSVTGSGGSDPSVSPDGRFVAFVRSAAGAPGPVFVFDRLTSVESRLDVDAFGTPGNGASTLWRRALSDHALDGTFSSSSTDLVANDANGVADVFAHGPSDDFGAFCFGDGSGTACPCGNAATAGFGGCPNTFSPNGARLRGAGEATVAYDSTALVADSLPSTSTTWFGYSLTPIPLGVVFSDGLQCLGGSSAILGSTPAVAGVASLGFHAQVPLSISAATSALAGQTQYFQARYRSAYCASSSINFTNALKVTWQL